MGLWQLPIRAWTLLQALFARGWTRHKGLWKWALMSCPNLCFNPHLHIVPSFAGFHLHVIQVYVPETNIPHLIFHLHISLSFDEQFTQLRVILEWLVPVPCVLHQDGRWKSYPYPRQSSYRRWAPYHKIGDARRKIQVTLYGLWFCHKPSSDVTWTWLSLDGEHGNTAASSAKVNEVMNCLYFGAKTGEQHILGSFLRMLMPKKIENPTKKSNIRTVDFKICLQTSSCAIFDQVNPAYYHSMYSGHGFPNFVSRTMPYPFDVYIIDCSLEVAQPPILWAVCQILECFSLQQQE